MRTLVINTYGGSLLLGATALGCEVIGSYEDAGFGLPIQQANFPRLNFRAKRSQWPKQDLSETVVIAHPPCSAFSTQNTSKVTRGVDSAAFACTKSVLEYATSNRALGIAVESVMGALPGAWRIHQSFADDCGYHIYRIVQNGAMFMPQWRERFWVVYVRKGAVPQRELELRLTPRWLRVKDVVTGYEEGPAAGDTDRLLERQRTRLIERAGLNEFDLWYLFSPHNHGKIPLGKLLWKHKFPTRPINEVFREYVSGFASGTLNYLDPDGTAPVLMGGSWWYYNGRNLSENGYKRIMGFPPNYIFPESPRNFRKGMRMYLSKGVIPQVAQWILEQLGRHLKMLPEEVLTPEKDPYVVVCRPNSIADFRIRRKDWGQHRPELRQTDERDLYIDLGERAHGQQQLPGCGELSSQVRA